jgi:hypothetical protein
MLVQLKDILKEKGSGILPRVSCSCTTNAPGHWTHAIQKQLAYLGFQCLVHPPYSPDFASSDYRLFLGLNKQL